MTSEPSLWGNDDEAHVVRSGMSGFLKWSLIGCGTLLGLLILASVASVVLLGIAVHNISRGHGWMAYGGEVGVTLPAGHNLTATLTAVTTSQGTGAERPERGDVFVITHWRFHNRGSRPARLDTASFHAGVANGFVGQIQTTSLSHHMLPLAVVTIRPRGRLTGDMVFEAPAHARITVRQTRGSVSSWWTFRA